WVEEENKVTFGYLDQIPVRAKLKERLTKLWNYERYGVPRHEGGHYFYSKNDGLQNQNVLYTIQALKDEPRMLIDPNQWSTDGTVALGSYSLTDDGKYMAYSVQSAGSDWIEWKVKEVASGKDLPDHIKWSKFSNASWLKDGSGFFYSRYDEPKPGENAYTGANYFQKIYFHKLGTEQAQDHLVYERKDHKDWGMGGDVTDDGRYLIINVSQGTDPKNRVYYKDLKDPNAKVVPLLDDFDAQYDFVDNDGPVFWFRTDLDAPHYRVIAIDTRHPERANWKTIIAETQDTLDDANVINNRFLGNYLHDAHSIVKIYDLRGKLEREIAMPGIGSAAGFPGKRSDKETFYSFTSFTVPTTIYRLDMATLTSEVFRRPTVDFDPNAYETKQVFYTSKDGTRIPMFITAKKGVKLDGQNPTLLYGYGGFNLSITPAFSVPNLVWMEMGGVYALATLRGGGEYGKAWHEAGMLHNKQNVFDDFIAAAEWLIANKYTSTPKLAVDGRSNGGLLVGAVETQRPDLFGACLPNVGVMDMLRFHKFTIGWAWTSDYGSPDDPKDFEYIRKYSPLQNIKPGTKYPPTLITTADHDDRVVPGHSFKFAAAMQAAQAGDAPVLIRIETRAGHGGGGVGVPTTKLIEQAADRWGFLVHVLGMEQEVERTQQAAQ
ncbi:MAG TPA: prolyl oligopeptidase family serine peptidase, partial [Terriglobales bacterium]|nr:prolyl oligopeptidase family serine peptidase [Terriglobales bacterium]